MVADVASPVAMVRRYDPYRSTTCCVIGSPGQTVRSARTFRRRLLALPDARRWTLDLPTRWPWQRSFVEALTRIRALPAAG